MLYTFYGVTKRKAGQQSVHTLHANIHYPLAQEAVVFSEFEQPLLILCYSFTAFSSSWSVNHDYLMLSWHQLSEVGVISILPEEETY